MRTITISAEKCNELKVINRLVKIAKKQTIAVHVDGEIPPDSLYAGCLLRGAMFALDKDSRVALLRGPEVLKSTEHLWVRGGYLETMIT